MAPCKPEALPPLFSLRASFQTPSSMACSDVSVSAQPPLCALALDASLAAPVRAPGAFKWRFEMAFCRAARAGSGGALRLSSNSPPRGVALEAALPGRCLARFWRPCASSKWPPLYLPPLRCSMGRKICDVKANRWTRTFALAPLLAGTNVVSSKQMPTSLRLKRACSSSFTIFASSPVHLWEINR